MRQIWCVVAPAREYPAQDSRVNAEGSVPSEEVRIMNKSLLVLLLTAVTVYAQTPAIPTAMESYDWIIGRWECKGVTP
jgi:hypothetical protein